MPQDVVLVDVDLGVVRSGIEDLCMEAVGLWGDPLMQAFYPYSILHTAPYGIWNMECNPYGT